MNNKIGEEHMDPLEKGSVHQAMTQGTRGPNIRGSSTGNRQTSNDRPTQDTHATGRCDSRNGSQATKGRNNPSVSDRREDPNPEPSSGAMILRRQGIQETLHQWSQPLKF